MTSGRGPSANPDEPDPELDAAIAAADADAAASLSEAPKLEEHPDYDYAPDVVVVDGAHIDGTGFRFTALHTPGPHLQSPVLRARTTLAVRCTNRLHRRSRDGVVDNDRAAARRGHGRVLRQFAAVARLSRRHVLPDAWPADPAGPRVRPTALLAHRREREAQVLEQLAAGPRTILTMVKVMYTDVGVGPAPTGDPLRFVAPRQAGRRGQGALRYLGSHATVHVLARPQRPARGRLRPEVHPQMPLDSVDDVTRSLNELRRMLAANDLSGVRKLVYFGAARLVARAPRAA
jgi:hypothetical protein